MAWHIDPFVSTPTEPTELVAYLRKWSYSSGLGDWWDDTAGDFDASPTQADVEIAVAEDPASTGLFTGSSSADLGTYTGHVMEVIRAASTDEVVLSSSLANPKVFYCRNGKKQSVVESVSPVSVSDVGDGREWAVERDGRVHPTLIIAATDSVTLSMNFDRFLNPETSISTADSVTDQSGNALSTSGLVLSGDKRKLYFDVATADLTAATTYLMRCTGTTTDSQTISADGPLKTRA